jgi:hypothetical protein
MAMLVLNKKAFKLPFMDRERFVLLMRLGLNYDRATGMFCVANFNNIEKLSDTIAEILKVDEVTFTQTCAVCGKDFGCSDCKYLELCATKNLPFQCVCQECLRGGKTFEDKS